MTAPPAFVLVFGGQSVTFALPAMLTPPIFPLESGRMMNVTPVPPAVELHVQVGLGQLSVVLFGMSIEKPLLFPCPLPCPLVGPSTPATK